MEYYELVRIHRGNQVTAQQQLAAAIKASGLSASAYARQVLVREPRTVRRWLAGDSPIPEAVLQFLERQNSERASG